MTPATEQTLGKRWSWRRFWRLRALLYRLGWLRLPHHRRSVVAGDIGTRLSTMLVESGLAPERQDDTEDERREHLAAHYRDAGVAPPWEESAMSDDHRPDDPTLAHQWKAVEPNLPTYGQIEYQLFDNGCLRMRWDGMPMWIGLGEPPLSLVSEFIKLKRRPIAEERGKEPPEDDSPCA